MASGSAEKRQAEFLDYLQAKRPGIAHELSAVASRRGADLESRMGGGRDLLARLLELSLQGKMIRGCLVFLGRDAVSEAATAHPGVAGVAAAMELFQTGLLVHDDIMDRDSLRRGMPTIHTRYSTELEEAGVAESARIGDALGICAGDAAYFEAFAELARSLGQGPRSGEILALCAEFLSEVVVAQMADVRWGASRGEAAEEDILAMYRCKTARYSFSLPLSVGAIYAGDPIVAGDLIELGERLGILFQLRDDELGLFGDEGSTGKAVGSDLREGKKTLFRARLLAAAPDDERQGLAALFDGSAEARPDDLARIRRLSEELGVRRSIEELARSKEEEAYAILRRLAGRKRAGPGNGGLGAVAILEGLVAYVTRRDK